MTTWLMVVGSVVAAAVAGSSAAAGGGLCAGGPHCFASIQAAVAAGFAQGGGIWNGALFGPPDSPLTLSNSQVTGNDFTGSAGIDIAGAGIFSAGFPLTLDHAVVARNAPDRCVGC